MYPYKSSSLIYTPSPLHQHNFQLVKATPVQLILNGIGFITLTAMCLRLSIEFCYNELLHPYVYERQCDPWGWWYSSEDIRYSLSVAINPSVSLSSHLIDFSFHLCPPRPFAMVIMQFSCCPTQPN